MSAGERPLAEKIALVTGGSGGIGAAVCRRLASAGATVLLTYGSNAGTAQQVLDALPPDQRGGLFAADVGDSASLARIADEIRSAYGHLDILVNTVGMTRPVPHAELDELDDALIDEIFRVNWRGTFALIRACRPLLDAAPEAGIVVNISSIAGTTGEGSNVAYAASKAALDSMTRSLARALAPNIRVVSVAPGLVEGKYAEKLDPAWREAQRARTPLARLASEDDVAEAVYAAAAHLRFSTGFVLPVDGGRPLG